jgi:hypothetical protein
MPRPPPRRRSPGRAYPRRPVSTAKDRRAVLCSAPKFGSVSPPAAASRVHEPVARSREGYAGEDHERETRTSTSGRSWLDTALDDEGRPSSIPRRPATRGLRSRAATDGTVVPASRLSGDRAAALPLVAGDRRDLARTVHRRRRDRWMGGRPRHRASRGRDRSGVLEWRPRRRARPAARNAENRSSAVVAMRTARDRIRTMDQRSDP